MTGALSARVLVVRLVLLASVVAGLMLAVAPGAVAAAFDLNPNHFADWAAGGNGAAGGRVVGIAVDPADGKHAWALAENGGVFGTIDGGNHWQGNLRPDGSPGRYGRGLGRHGLTNFDDIAVDPHDPAVLLVLASTDHRAHNTQEGIWRSSDGGVRWTHISAPPCDIAYAGYGEGTEGSGHVVFAPTLRGVALATTPCGIGTTSDDGLHWRWDATGSMPFLSGLAAVSAGKIKADTFAFCGVGPLPGGPGQAVGVWTLKRSPVWYAVPPGADAGTDCAVAFDPYSATTLYFAARVGGHVHVYEGRITGPSVTWTDLNGPTFADANGRPPVLATHPDTGGFRLYYSNTTLFTWEHCTTHCPVPTSASPSNCTPDVAAPWHCMAYFHADFAAIAFDPQKPAVACPLYAVGDGGVIGETRCGNDVNHDGLPRNTGLHALQVYAASRTFDGDIVLATQDNWALQLRSGTWRSDFCGDSTDTDALGQAQYLQTCDAGSNVVVPAVNEHRDWPWGHATDVGLPNGLVPGAKLRFSNPLTLAGAVVVNRQGSHYLHIVVHGVGPSSRWARVIPGHQISADGTACCGMFAIGGRAEPRGITPRFYVSVASDSSSLARKLYCNEDGHWYDAVGVPDPVAVWAAPQSERWTLVWDASTEKLYTETGAPCHFTPALAASRLITGNGTWADPTNNGSRYWLVSTIGFDAGRPGRAFIGTRHNGILVTDNHGRSWEISHEFPEPNDGETTLLASDAAIGAGTPVEGVLASSWGRGVWQIHLDIAGERYLGFPDENVSERRHRFEVRARCGARTSCTGSIDLQAYLPAARGHLQVQSIGAVRVPGLASGETRTFEISVADHIQRALSRSSYIARVTGTLTSRFGHFTSTRLVIIHPR